MPLLRVLTGSMTGLHRLRTSLLPCLLIGIALVLVSLLALGLRNVTGLLLILLLLPWLLRLRSLAGTRMLGMLSLLVIGHTHLRIS